MNLEVSFLMKFSPGKLNIFYLGYKQPKYMANNYPDVENEIAKVKALSSV